MVSAERVLTDSNPYVKSVTLKDLTDSKAKEYNVDDLMKITWNFDILKGSDIKDGDQLKFYVPDVFHFDEKIQAGVDKVANFTTPDGIVIGTTSMTSDRYVEITWNKEAEEFFKHNDLVDNQLNAYVGWDKITGNKSQVVPIDWKLNNIPVPSNPSVSPSSTPTPSPSPNNDYVINKSGNYGNYDEAGYIYWQVRVKANGQNIKNAVLTDTASKGQTIAGDKDFVIWEYDINADGTLNYDTRQRLNLRLSDKRIQHDASSFKINFDQYIPNGELVQNKVYEVFYFTKYDPAATADGTQFTNSAELTGDGVKADANDVHTAEKLFIYEFLIGKKRTVPEPTPDPTPTPIPVKPTPAPTPTPVDPVPQPSPAVPKHSPFVLPSTGGGSENDSGSENLNVQQQKAKAKIALPVTAKNLKKTIPAITIPMVVVFGTSMTIWLKSRKRND